MQQPERERHRQSRFDALAVALAQELRKPLSTVTMNLELIREEISRLDPSAVPAVRKLDLALDEIRRLDRVFAEFLRLALQPEPELAPADVNQVIEDLVGVVAGALRARRVTPVLQLDRRVAPVMVDQRLVRQAFLCLLDNVVGTLDGGTLTIQTRRRDATVEVDVIDTGPGHPPETWPRLFDSYFTLMSGGAGAGLALVRQIVELHRGRVEYEGATGWGNRIRLTLPGTGAS